MIGLRGIARFGLVCSSIVLAIACPEVRAQGTYTAASDAESDVNAVINGPTHTAVNGDVTPDSVQRDAVCGVVEPACGNRQHYDHSTGRHSELWVKRFWVWNKLPDDSRRLHGERTSF